MESEVETLSLAIKVFNFSRAPWGCVQAAVDLEQSIGKQFSLVVPFTDSHWTNGLVALFMDRMGVRACVGIESNASSLIMQRNYLPRAVTRFRDQNGPYSSARPVSRTVRHCIDALKVDLYSTVSSGTVSARSRSDESIQRALKHWDTRYGSFSLCTIQLQWNFRSPVAHWNLARLQIRICCEF